MAIFLFFFLELVTIKHDAVAPCKATAPIMFEYYSFMLIVQNHVHDACHVIHGNCSIAVNVCILKYKDL